MITQWRQEVRMEEALPSAPALWGRGRFSAHIKGGGEERVEGAGRRPGNALAGRAACKGRPHLGDFSTLSGPKQALTSFVVRSLILAGPLP